MSAIKRLHDGEDGGRTLVTGVVWTLEAEGAIHEHNDATRSPERCRERARGVDVHQLHRPLGVRRRVMGSWRPVPILLSNILNMEPILQSNKTRVASLSLAIRSHRHGRRRRGDG